MTSIIEIDVDLNVPPEMRWEALAPFRNQARELLQFYIRDLGGLDRFAPLLAEYRDGYIDPEYVAEMRGVARVIGMPEEEVVLGNLYYDALRLVLTGGMGCTAFAIDTPAGTLHARNLDWTTADGKLASETIVCNFRRGTSAPLYRTVAWPGFVGCLSGVARGRLAVTVNAVLSDDPPALGAPLAFVLRRVLETATYDEAVVALRDTALASDSLLLLTGANVGEMVVIERAPTRGAIRGPRDGAVFVTNDYRALSKSVSTGGPSALARTSCTRFDRAESLVRASPPRDAESCLAVLRDSRVRLGITVQHLVLSAADGSVTVALP